MRQILFCHHPTYWHVSSTSSTNGLIVRPSQLFPVGDRAFPVAGANLWNDLPDELTSLQSQLSFRRQLKTFFFRSSHPDFRCMLADFNRNLSDLSSFDVSVDAPSPPGGRQPGLRVVWIDVRPLYDVIHDPASGLLVLLFYSWLPLKRIDQCEYSYDPLAAVANWSIATSTQQRRQSMLHLPSCSPLYVEPPSTGLNDFANEFTDLPPNSLMPAFPRAAAATARSVNCMDHGCAAWSINI